MTEKLNAEKIDEIIDKASGITLDINHSTVTVDTDLYAYKFDVKDDDIHPVIQSMIYFISKIPYLKSSQDTLIELCNNTCAGKIDAIIKYGVANNEKVTPIVLKCCAELLSVIVKVNPVMVMEEGSDFILKAFNVIYGPTVRRINELREENT